MTNCLCNGLFNDDGTEGGCRKSKNKEFMNSNEPWCFVGEKGGADATRDNTELPSGCGEKPDEGANPKIVWDATNLMWKTSLATDNCKYLYPRSECACNQKSEKYASRDDTLVGGDCEPKVYKDKTGGDINNGNKFCNVGNTEDIDKNKKFVAEYCLGIGLNIDSDVTDKISISNDNPKYVRVAPKGTTSTVDLVNIKLVNDSCDKGMKTWGLLTIIGGSILAVILALIIFYMLM